MRYFALAATALGAGVLTLTAPVGAASSPPVHHVRGTLEKIGAASVTVKTAGGDVTVPIDAKTKVLAVVPSDAAAITTGTFIGTANVPSANGPARALEVVVFPAAMKGTGEGDYGWDLAPGGHGSSSMTNGTVTGGAHASSMSGGMMGGSTMTNATVTSAKFSGAQKTVTLKYAGGTKTVAIGDVPIVKIMPGERKELVPGANVVVFPGAKPNGPARAVVVGESGATPPM